ncbi:hypothetical protein ACFOOK_02585 [Micromonospora krabiensis]|uniref:Uncharacterized protein n=1 Tax=Micromonospora krabiensis TaxID=307121 RepID=A0A1C3MWS7_9ACTN|nr:hypothetical protein [Micromonospora krabiensis]SBV24754.1 hypothetical protein GA0070620_0193 [Micromonospora krabiensis]
MTTDTSALRVESQALVAFGRERYEDAVAYSAVRRYLSDVGSIPSGAWGTLEGISEKLHRDWATALSSRLSEANTARNEMERMADGLMQIAADYEGTDLDIATTFDLQNRDLLPYLPLGDGHAGSVRVRPGGAGILAQPAPRKAIPGDEPVLMIPDDNERLGATRNETLPRTRVVEEPIRIGSTDGNDLTISGGRTTYYENGEGDQLDTFIHEHRDTLLQLEAILIELGTGERLPLTDLMVHAWRSSPRIIRNRADLVHSAANTYAELRAEMGGELKNLKLYWEGSAFQAFGHYADRAGLYLDQLVTQTRWLADEGKKAATMLEGLRNAYASLGYQHIGTLIDALKGYLESVNGLFSSCSEPEKALLTVVQTFVGYLLDAERRSVEAMSELIKIDEQERKERPDLGTRSHDTTPFPQPEVGADAWSDRSSWAPRPDKPRA